MSATPEGGRHALVLGASGFIGRWVARRLTQLGTRVSAAVRDGGRTKALLDQWNARADIVEVDLEEPGAATELVARTRPSHVFNLVAYGIDRNERDDVRSRRLNHDLVRELARACAPDATWPGAVLVHTGSAAEYGRAGGVLHESAETLPTTTYGRTKLAGTQALAESARDGTRGVTARLFTVFGDGEHAGRLFPSLRHTAATSAPLDLSDGLQERDFAFVEDVAAALVDVADAPFIPGETINLASGRMHTVQAFVRTAARELGIPDASLRFGSLPTRPDEMQHTGVAVERMQQVLGHALPSGLSEMVTRAVRDAAARGQ
ncbi:MAG: NAD-dependent epimerase/dehydratase family protein [Gemmatimonadaceae bacterium]